MLTVGSLFSGVGGIDLGLERTGMEIRFQCEIDPNCNKILAKHWSDVPNLGDIRTVEWQIAPYVDLICGGFPCQDLSHAGKGVGLTGERSGLWGEMLKCINALQPYYVLIENVGRAWRRWVPSVRRDLYRGGFASLPIRLRAADFGAPHDRSRVFIIAANVERLKLRFELWGQKHPGSSPATKILATIARQVQTIANAIHKGELQSGGGKSAERGWPGDCTWWEVEPDVDRVVHGVSTRLDRSRRLAREKMLGNAVVPQKTEWLGRALIASHLSLEEH